MTQQRIDNKSTPFGLWLRHQSEIDSRKGFVTTNMDYIWEDTKSGKWMLIEEKCLIAEMKPFQKKLFEKLCSSISDPLFKGFHFLQFQFFSPDEGWMKLDGKKITREQLISFLKFENECV